MPLSAPPIMFSSMAGPKKYFTKTTTGINSKVNTQREIRIFLQSLFMRKKTSITARACRPFCLANVAKIPKVMDEEKKTNEYSLFFLSVLSKKYHDVSIKRDMHESGRARKYQGAVVINIKAQAIILIVERTPSFRVRRRYARIS